MHRDQWSLRQCPLFWLSGVTDSASSLGSFSVTVTLVLCWSYRQHCGIHTDVTEYTSLCREDTFAGHQR